MVDIFDEVDEDVRREKMQAAAKKYGPILGVVVALIIGSVGGVTFWRQHQAAQKMEAGATFLDAARAEIEEPGTTAEAFAALGEEGPGGYQALARLKQAEALAASGDRAAAIEALNGVEGVDVPERYKELARLLALSLRSYDEKPEALLPLVEPLTAAGKPWRALAIEQAAALEWKMGRLAEARARFEALSADIAAPVSVRARADAALTALPEG